MLLERRDRVLSVSKAVAGEVMNSLRNVYSKIDQTYNQEDWWFDESWDEILKLKSEKIQSGQYVYDLSMINPDLPPHIFLMDKLLEATIQKENHRYAVSRGIFKLRQAFSQKYAHTFSANVDPETEACVTFGSKDAVSSFLASNVRRGQKVLLPDPIYPAHLSAVRLAGLVPFFFRQANEKSMIEEIANIINKEIIDYIFLNFPSNPTGKVVSKEFYKQLYYTIKNKGIIVYNDFTYGEMLYKGAECPSILSIPGMKEYAVESYSLSKAYNVPGWRVGAMLGNEEVIKRMSTLKSYTDYGLFLAIQSAAASALTCTQDLVKDTVATYAERMKFFCGKLQELGWEVENPSAGACVWAKFPKKFRGENSYRNACFLLNKTNVCGTPGELYSRFARDNIRFALVRPIDILERTVEALSKLQG